MSDISSLVFNGNNQNKTAALVANNKPTSVASQLAAGEKTQSMLEVEKNNGGFFGGIGYALEKLGLGFLSSIEGIWDFTAGGLAKLFGADDWAEQQFANDWVNYGHADEWYNPSEGWQFVGDVTGGIGTSLPAIATTAAAALIAVASGGTLAPVAAGLIAGTVAGLGAAGNATKEAYRQTGELGGKEFGYGALVGVTEGAVEGLSSAIGAGTGAVVKGITKSFGKEIAESATRQTLGKAVVKGFVGEAFEEGLSEMLNPVWARLTYDPNAKNATFQEVGYAALVGGLSGAIMGGVDVSVRNISSTARGNTIATEGKTDNVLKMAEQLNTYEQTNKTGLESFELVQNVYNELQASLQKTNGKISTVKQKMLLGVLEKANTNAVFSPIVARSAENIVNNAETIAEKITAYGLTDADGKPITFTAEQIRNGVDANNSKSFSKALKTNDILRSLAVADATGQISMDTAKFKESTLMGQKLSSQADLNRFIETATDSELKAVGEKLGIDNWQGITNAEFQEKITDFVKNGGVESYKNERLVIKDAENVAADTAKPLPKRLNMKEDGIKRYSQGDSQIAIFKKGDSYQIYDYSSKRLSKTLTYQEVNKVLRQLNTEQGNVATEIRQQLEQESELRKQAAEIDSYARENIADYNKLNAPSQSMIRAVIRQGRAAGIAESDVLSYARVSAHSGINIVFSEKMCIIGTNTQTGKNIYSDGYYDAKNNRIVVNPNTKRTHEALLIHELDHAIRATEDGGIIIEEGVKNMSQEDKDAIINRYRNAGRGGSVELVGELSAHYAEGMLTNKNILEKLCETKPTLKEKILNFFKKSATTYSEDVKLSKEAQSLYKRYKKLFDDFSLGKKKGGQRIGGNQGSNANEYIAADSTNKKQFALPKIDSYTEKQYNNYGWARANDFLTAGGNQYFHDLFNQETRKQGAYKTANGDFIIPTYDDLGKKNNANNVLVFAKGTENNPIISKILKIEFTDESYLNETNLSILEEYIYEQERNNTTNEYLAVVKSIYKKANIVEYTKTDSQDYRAYKGDQRRGRSGESRSKHNRDNQQQRNRGANSKGNKNSVKPKLVRLDAENRVEYYSDGTQRRYALPDTDSTGTKLSDSQLKFFKDSKAVDKQGQLLQVYHGTNAEFFEFNKDFIGTNFGQDEVGFFFTDSQKVAEEYANNTSYGTKRAKSGIVKECYVNIKKPLKIRIDYDSIDYWDNNYATLIEKAQKNGNDGIIIKADKYDSLYVVFESNQIKLTTNKTPTTSPDIRYALPQVDSEGNPLTTEQRKFFEHSKVVDRYGNLKVVYHGTMSGDFTVFDASKASPEGDMGAGFYFSDSYDDVNSNYEEGGQDLDAKIDRLADRIAVEEDIEYEEAYEKAVAELSKSSKLFEVYLNMENPAYTGGDFDSPTYLFADLDDNGLLMEDFDSEDDYYDAQWQARDEALEEIVAKVDRILSEKGIYGYDDWVSILSMYEVFEGGTTISELKDILNKNLFDVYDNDGNAAVNELVRAIIEALGYDGIIDNSVNSKWGYNSGRINIMNGIDEETHHYIVFKPEQIKYVSNESPTKNQDIRFALQEDNPTRGGFTKGQRAKFVANNTKFKIYSKTDATEVINSILEERLVFDEKFGKLSGKSKAEVIDFLFTKLNNTEPAYQGTVALKIADYIIENTLLEDIYTIDKSEDMRVLSILRSYMHNINLSGIQGEIQYKFGKKNGINMLWGNKNATQTPDTIAQELAEYGIIIESTNEADIFFEILDKYESAKEVVNQKVDTVKLKTFGSESELKQLRQQIARDILLAYDEKGTQSKYGKLVEKYTGKIAELRKQVKESSKKNSLVNSIIDSAQYLRDIANKRSYVGAEVFNAPELTSWLKELGKIKYRSDIRKSGARAVLLNYGKFYNTNNPLLYDPDPNLNYIDENVIDAINFIKANETSTAPLSLEELQAAQVIMASAKHLFKNYDQMILEGKKVSITETAAKGIDILKQSKNRVGKSFFNNIYGAFNKVVEPRVVIKSFENFDPNGILTRAYKQITDGETASGLMYIDLVSEFDNFFKQNKKYKQRLASEYVKVGGAELTIGQAISLYEISKREQAKAGLYESGFSYLDKKGAKQSVKITEKHIQDLYQSFTEADKEFVAIVEDFFNVKSKQVKTNADLEILGYTNTQEDFYFPIKRDSGTIARNVTDARNIMSDWANVYNFSFNKDVKAGSKNKLFIADVYSIVSRHAKQLSTYANLTVPLKNFSQLYAKNIGSKTDVQTIKNTLNEQVWGGADGYLTKLFADIQGRATSNSFIEKLRGAYAKYQLGANLKVIVSQVTSYPTAGVILDIDSMAKGAVMKTDYKALDVHCAYAKVRNYEKGVVRAEGVVDKVGKVGDILTKPIQWTDRLTIGKLWNACQVQVQKDNGLKIGTTENMKAAGVLLEEVVRLTQPNYTNTERSELMRSDSDIVRSFTMFTSVPLKQLSRLVESVGEYNALRQMVKSGNTSTEIATRYKVAKRKLGRTLAAITVANLMYVLVGQFFKWLYNKDRKDKDGNEISVIQDMLSDFVSTNIGMLPIVKDIYSFFVNDYEFSNFAYETVESLLSSSKELFELATKAANGEIINTSDYMRALRNSLYSVGQITGIPTRNINNLISGLTKRFDPAAAYKYNSMFYNARYSQDIKEALAKGDYRLAETIMSLMLRDDKAGNANSAVTTKLVELYEKEYSVLPKSIGDTVSHNGESIKLNREQKTKFKQVYGQANNKVESLISNNTFKTLSEEKQAKAIKQIYDAYYAKALSETLGVTSDNKLLALSKYMDIVQLSAVYAGMSDIVSDIDIKGKTIAGSKKNKLVKYLRSQNLTKEQMLLLLAYQGYSVQDREVGGLTAEQAKKRLLRYILTSKTTTQAEKANIAAKCGFNVKNGRILASSL